VKGNGYVSGSSNLYSAHLTSAPVNIGIVLVDPTNADVRLPGLSHGSKLKQRPLQGSIENFCGFEDFVSWSANQLESTTKVSVQFLDRPRTVERPFPEGQEPLIDWLLRHFQHQPELMDNPSPSILDFVYYPSQLMISEWIRYSLLLGRYVKHYEYAITSSSAGLKQSNVEELLPWRRRCTQSLHKLALFRISIESHLHKSGYEAERTWKPMLQDVDHIISQIEHSASFLRSTVPLLDAHQSLMEAQSVRRLEYIVLVFTPLSLVASVLSMSDHVLPWGGQFWIYFAIAIPLTVLILFAYILVPRILQRFENSI
jgi:hypothetical protein